jgi:aspartyl protease family protein
MLFSRLMICCAVLLLALPAHATDVSVQALFTDAAVLLINGERKMLRVGQEHDGVELIEATSQSAQLIVDGQRRELQVTRHIGANFSQPERREVTISRDQMMQYQTSALINGRRVQVLVDTGANVVAMNTSQARALGVNYHAGASARVTTASGNVPAKRVMLKSVDVGGIRVDGVAATVLQGNFPDTILLGMSFLKHVKMEEEGGILRLSREW